MKRLKHLKFARNRRAVSAVVSNMILIAAVLTIGLVALVWSQNQSADYQKTQTATINEKIYQLKEKLSLEYTNYTSGTLKVYLLNSGLVNVKIDNVTLSNAPTTPLDFKIYQIDSPVEITNKTLGTSTNKEGYIQISGLSLSGTYSVTIKTESINPKNTFGGSTFVYTFAV